MATQVEVNIHITRYLFKLLHLVRTLIGASLTKSYYLEWLQEIGPQR